MVAQNEQVLSRKPKSGKVWKEKKEAKFSNLLIQNQQRTSWKKKMELKAAKLNLAKHMQELNEEKKKTKLELLERQKRNKERRLENEKKMAEAALKKSGAKKTKKLKIKR